MSQKKNFKQIIDYLIDSYYLNPKKKLTAELIRINLEILDCPILPEFISYMEKQNYITYDKTTKENFIINYEGVIYLEKLQRDNKKYENNLIGIVISTGALIASAFGLLASDDITIRRNLFVVVCIFIGCLFKSLIDILKKKYY